MPKVFYQNSKTFRVVSVVKRCIGLVKVEYWTSKHHAWFSVEDFNRVFKKIE
jgi:hypothetical protein